MSEKNIRKEYTNGTITIVWEPHKCIHSGICVKTLPQVYDPQGKPWIKPGNASSEALQKQVDQCPSGALSWYLNDAPSSGASSTAQETSVEILKDGPLMVSGTLQIKDADGKVTSSGLKTAFCRCGASSNKPFCDGSHRKIGFRG